MREPLKHDQLAPAIETTGFPLEYLVSERFRAAGWSIISNRYYVDDTDGKARELDLIAYAVDKIEDVEVLTSLLLSCKKDAQNTWVFLSRNVSKDDPNTDWRPVHIWTDEEPLSSYLGSEEWKTRFAADGVKECPFHFQTDRDVFAFQQVQASSSPSSGAPLPPGKPQNDTAIFGAVSGLLKALDSEVSALASRMANRRRIYLFSLGVVVDAPLVDFQFSKNGQTRSVPLNHLLHLARYMVRKRHLQALVHFIRSDEVDKLIAQMEKLRNFNKQRSAKLIGASYRAFPKNAAVRAHFRKILKPKIIRVVNEGLRDLKRKPRISDVDFYVGASGALVVEVDTTTDEVDMLAAHAQTMKKLKELLKQSAKYEGEFELESEIPF